MSPLAPQTFEDITPAQFDALEAKVKSMTGINIVTNDGEHSAQGFDIKWDYNPDTQVLVIQIMHIPFPESLAPGAVQQKVTDLVNGN